MPSPVTLSAGTTTLQLAKARLAPGANAALKRAMGSMATTQGSQLASLAQAAGGSNGLLGAAAGEGGIAGLLTSGGDGRGSSLFGATSALSSMLGGQGGLVVRGGGGMRALSTSDLQQLAARGRAGLMPTRYTPPDAASARSQQRELRAALDELEASFGGTAGRWMEEVDALAPMPGGMIPLDPVTGLPISYRLSDIDFIAPLPESLAPRWAVSAPAEAPPEPSPEPSPEPVTPPADPGDGSGGEVTPPDDPSDEQP